ncbi:DUF4349 domain-containing protein [Telluribacter sp.]|jgi:hypothetical protein|uniref:DUF4349 domain-containing protein n=1 Tax=Telluribacter sp. TaxID=1978767 RepID=UPI002E0E4541|nr:DUF4349 domain-containing protein [Telluribacter sp.]
MKIKPTITATLVGSLLFILSCSQFQEHERNEEVMVEVDLMKVPLPPDAASVPPQQGEPLPSTPQANQQKTVRKIIRSGSLGFETMDAENTRGLIDKSLTTYKGYVSNDEIDKTSDRIQYSLTIRVPAENFDLFLESIQKSTSSFIDKKVEAQDVTEEYIDVEARLRTKKDLESRYKVLLQRANSVQDVLAIEKEIGKLRAEIESTEGRFRYLNDRISFSTVRIEYYVVTGQSLAFISQAGPAFKQGWDNLLTFFISLIYVWPFLLIVVVATLILLRSLKKSRSNRVIPEIQS